MNFAHLHIHNEFSYLDGVGTAESYAKRAVALGIKHIGLTNHGNIDGTIRWQAKCKEQGVHAILGVEAYVVPDRLWRPTSRKEKDVRYHITLLAKNMTGWYNLLQLMSAANIDGVFKGGWGREYARIDPGLLLKHIEGLIILSGCQNSFLNMPDNRIDEIISAAGDDFYLEVMPVLLDKQKEHNQVVVDIAHATGIKLVATNDCHYVVAGDEGVQEVLLAIQSKAKWNDPKRWRFNIDGLHLRTRDEMVLAFMRQGTLSKGDIQASLNNTIEVAEKCGLYVEEVPVVLPKVAVPQYPDLPEDEQLIQLSIDGLKAKAEKHVWIAEQIDTYHERLTDELTQIIDLGFAMYFLVVWELISWCENNDIMCGPGRGSVGGSLVAYCMNITKVDPIKYELVFSRFISPARIDLPDIDMDFEDRKRDKIREHLEDLYGEWNVCALSNYQQMHGRGALRDVARVFDLPSKDVDKAAKSIVVRSGGDLRGDFSIEDSFMAFEDGRRFYEKFPNESKIAMRLEGQIKTAGKHAAAMCIVLDDIRSGKNCAYVRRKDELIANWDKWDCEHMGLMKLDVLGLNELTKLAECRKLIKKRHGVDVDYESIDLEDKKCLAEFDAGNNIGCFQLNSLGMMRICQEIGIDEFNDVVAINALHRPGCLRAGMVTEYKLRKQGEKEIPSVHPMIDELCKKTYGIVLYQEQVMLLMYNLAGMPWRTADAIRKVVSKKLGESNS